MFPEGCTAVKKVAQAVRTGRARFLGGVVAQPGCLPLPEFEYVIYDMAQEGKQGLAL